MISLVPNLVTAPAAYPISIAEVRDQLGIDAQDGDTLISAHIAAATNLAENYLGQALITRTYHGYLDSWPWACTGYSARWRSTKRIVELPRPPLISVGYVRTYDASDAATTISASDYIVDASSFVGRIVFKSTATIDAPAREANGIEIAWTCGMGSTLRPFQDEDIRTALLIIVGALHENRGDEAAPTALPPAAEALLGPRRLVAV